MILWALTLLSAVLAALLTAHHGILRLAGEEAERAHHMKRALVWAGVLTILVMVANRLYGSLLMMALVGWTVYQCIKLVDAMTERLQPRQPE